MADMAARTASSILNDLAKNNKIVPHYETSEASGPPHQRIYKVCLKLGTLGEFEGTGTSIKNAKNVAASLALQQCTFPGSDSIKTIIQISPTVELNILAMRSGETVQYQELESVQVRNANPAQQYQNMIMQGGQAGRGFRPFSKIWRVALNVCGKAFIGQGKTKQNARNMAAKNALDVCREELLLKSQKNMMMQSMNSDVIGHRMLADPSGDAEERAGINKLYEIASKHRIGVKFDILNESGPPHLKRYIVKCIFGEKDTIGEGIGKKSARKSAALKMFEKVKDLEYSISNVGGLGKTNSRPRILGQGQTRRKKLTRTEKSIDPRLDPVTYLTQLMQLRHEPAPVYNIIRELGAKQRDRQFEMKVTVGENHEHQASGIANTKKKAKYMAAEHLLKSFGIEREKLTEEQRQAEAVIRKAREQASQSLNGGSYTSTVQMLNRAPGAPVTTHLNLQTSEMRLLNNKQKLEYIARLEGFQILYNDYDKNSDAEKYTSHVAVFTAPPVVFQGSGDSIEASREDAAGKALASLAQQGHTQVTGEIEG